MNVFCLSVLLSLFIPVVFGLNDKLSGESILYGIASLTENFTREKLTTCTEELNVLYRAVEEKQVWALKVLDASGQPGRGFLYGNNLWVGSRSYCIDIHNRNPLQVNHEKVVQSPPTDFDYPPFPVKFTKSSLKHNSTLQLHVHLPFDFTVHVGLCVPKSCSNKELFQLFKEYLLRHYLNIQRLYNLNLDVERVRSLEESPLFIFNLPKTILLTCVFAITLIFTIVGTILDMKRYYKEKSKLFSLKQNIEQITEKTVSEVELVKTFREPETIKTEESKICEIFRCFSLYSNVKSLVGVKGSKNSIRPIHGIRFFGMIWVSTVHSMYYSVDMARNVPYAFRLGELLEAEIFTNSTYAVDTYLFMSGFLLSYLYYKSKKMENQPVEFLKKIKEFIIMCLYRIMRFTPVYMLVILVSSVMFTYLRGTSSLESSEQADFNCDKYWWRNFLYINNLYPKSEICLSWSWYLSMDLQAFIIAAFLVIISTFAFKTAAFIAIFSIICCCLVTSLQSYSIGYIPTMDEQLHQVDKIYDLPWFRIGPYMVGTITGYLLVKKMKFKLILGKYSKVILWTLFPLLNLWILFTMHTKKFSLEFTAVYVGMSRTLWGIGIAWVVVACCTGNAVLMNKFLSFPGWIPLSRLTFSAYLLNPLVAVAMYLGTDFPFHVSKAGLTINACGVTLATFFFAFLLTVFFETPFNRLIKILLLRKVENPKTPETSDVTERT